MRTEATREEWQQLYDLAIQFKSMKPWKQFDALDIFCIKFSDEETGYMDVTGMEGDDISWGLYLGDDGLNDMLGILFAEDLEIPLDYMVRNQNSLNLYLGEREDVEEEQYRVIRDLGLKFRGKGNWIYFEADEKGFWPYLPDQKEVRTCTRYLEQFLNAVQYYREHKYDVEFAAGEIFEYFLENNQWKGHTRSILDQYYSRPCPVIADDIQAAKLKKAAKRKRNEILEVDMFYLDNAVCDQQYDKPVNVKMVLLVEKDSGMVLDQRTVMPEEDGISVVPSVLADWFVQNGAPRQVQVENTLMEALVNNVCETAGVPVEVLDQLPEMDETKDSLMGFLHRQSRSEDMEELSDELPDQDIMGLFAGMGLDMADLKNKAMTMSAEEFAEEAMEQMARAMRDKGFSEDEIASVLVDEPWDDGEDDSYTLLELKNRKQKIEAVMDFYGQGNIPGEVYAEFEKEILIGPGENTWEECLKEGRKEELLKIAEKMGAVVDKSFNKSMLVSIIMSKVALDSRTLSACMSKDSRKLLRFLRRKAEAQDEEYLLMEDFPNSMETVLELLNLGLVEVGYGFNEEALVLEIYPLTGEENPLGTFA